MAGLYSRENMIEAIKEHARGHIAKHSMNVEVYLSNAAGVGEHISLLVAGEAQHQATRDRGDGPADGEAPARTHRKQRQGHEAIQRTGGVRVRVRRDRYE